MYITIIHNDTNMWQKNDEGTKNKVSIYVFVKIYTLRVDKLPSYYAYDVC